MSLSYSHGREFVEQVRPFLEKQDPHGLVRFLSTYWSRHQVRGLLGCGHTDAMKAAAACLALTGTSEDNAALAPLLHSEDPTLVAIAEHALWSIWFQSGDEVADGRLQRAVRLIGENDFDGAIECLDCLLVRCPDFAEAYNQRAITYFLKEDYRASLADCRRTLRLNPFHFGAMAGIGHCYASLGQLQMALEAYRRALQMHPRLEGVHQSIQQIRCKFGAAARPIESPSRSTPS